MANWKYKLDISNIWHNEELPIEEKGKEIAKKIRATFPAEWLDFESESYDEELEGIVEAFENITGYDGAEPVEEFDDWMETLYDWADQEVAPFGQWPRNAMCWIETSYSKVKE